MTREDEKLILEQGLKSEFWQLVEAKFRPQLEKSLRAIKGRDATTRDRDVGLGIIAAKEEILDWPKERITTLERLIQEQNSSQ